MARHGTISVAAMLCNGWSTTSRFDPEERLILPYLAYPSSGGISDVVIISALALDADSPSPGIIRQDVGGLPYVNVSCDLHGLFLGTSLSTSLVCCVPRDEYALPNMFQPHKNLSCFECASNLSIDFFSARVDESQTENLLTSVIIPQKINR